MVKEFFKKLSSILPDMLEADVEDNDEEDEELEDEELEGDLSEEEMQIISSYEPIPLSFALRKRYLEEKGFEKYEVSKEKDITLS